MGRITSGIGLVSGINSRDIIDQLMSIESRPKSRLQSRAAALDQQRTAYADLSARLTGLRISATTLKKVSTFQNATATSSDENVLTATASPGAAVGAYTFSVARLVTTQQAVTRGFSDATAAKVPAGTITIKAGGGEVSAENLLNDLNGGAGVRRGAFRITDRAGNSAVIDLTSAVSVQDVVRRINTTLDVAVRAALDGDRIVLTDQTGRTDSNLIVQEIGDGATAEGLGLLGSVAANTLVGSDINTLGTRSTLDLLNDGRGVRKAGSGNDLAITLTDSSVVNVSLTTARTIGDVVSAINTAGAGKVTATVSASGNGLRLTDNTGSGAISVASVGTSQAASDLGLLGGGAGGVLEGKDVLTQLGTVSLASLNGGAGLTLGSIAIQSRAAGSATTINLSSATTVQGAIDLINAAGAGVRASVGRSGGGIQITDTSGGSGNLVISESGGTTAVDLGIAGSFDLATVAVQGKDLRRQYVSENSLLATYGGRGVTPGKFRITDTSGASAVVDLTQQNEVRLSDVIAEINSRGIGVTASINATGDGLLLTDTAGGALKLKVENVDGSTATDLGIEGQSTDASPTTIDGALSRTITTDGNDTLTTLAQKINDLGFGVSANIINDGTGSSPFRLSITARDSGRAGRFVFDSGTTGLDAGNLVDARDAAVFVGDPASSDPLLVTSSKNQLANLVRGVNVELNGLSDRPVTLSITNSVDNVVEELTKFTSNFNELSARIKTLTRFDTQTNTRGLLLGDGAIQQVQSEIFNMVQRALPEGGRYRILSDIGLKVGSGGELQFDADAFRQAYATDPDAVRNLFTRVAGGLTEGTPLSVLNNGRGVRTAGAGQPDLNIVTRDGSSFQVSLFASVTLGDVIRAINEAAEGKVTASIAAGGSGLVLSDGTTGAPGARLTVSALSGSLSASDLGIAGASGEGVINGSAIALPQARTVAGAGFQIETTINRLIDPVDGLITRQNKTLESRGDQFRDRITALDRLLTKKRERLERQFAQLENVLSGLQTQQAALGQIQNIRLPSRS